MRCNFWRLLEGVPNGRDPARVDDAAVSFEGGDIILQVEFSPYVVYAFLAVTS